MSPDLLSLLLHSTVALTSALATVLLLRHPLRRCSSCAAVYVLWLLVPLAVLASVLPAPRVHVPLLAMPTLASAGAPIVESVAAVSAALWPSLIVACWCAGALLRAWHLLQAQRRFVRSLGQLQRLPHNLWQAQFGAGCPAVVGVWPARLVLPPDFATRYGAQERELILAHEGIHLARGDAWANALALLLQCVFWFHPLFAYAVARFRHDQELACDAAVLRRFPQARRCYAGAMLKTQLAVPGLPVGCQWQSSHSLKERIAMLKRTQSGTLARALGIALALSASGVLPLAAWAMQTPERVSVAPATPQAALMQADVTLAIGNGPAREFRLINPLGQPFGVRSEPTEATDGDEPIAAELVVTSAGNDRFEVVADIRQGGRAVAHPRLLLREGERGEVVVGESAVQSPAVALAMTVRRAAAAEPVPAVADAANQPGREDGSSRQLKPPAYPAQQVRERINAEVVLHVQVLPDGSPGEVKLATVDVSSGQRSGSVPPRSSEQVRADAEAFTKASIVAVRTWRFEPAMEQGKAVTGWVEVPISFKISAH